MSQAAQDTPTGPLSAVWSIFRAPPPAKPITDPAEIRRGFAYFRPRILLWSTLGYGAFYFVRKNLDFAMPVMREQLHYTHQDLGLFLSLHGVVYGVCKFINGMLGDRADARIFMATGLMGSAILNLLFGFSSATLVMGTLWILNGYVQGMGYPPCAKLLTHWFHRRELASKMAMWNASHNLGSVGIALLCALLLRHWYSWRVCFTVPAVIAIAVAIALLVFLRDTPESVGLPDVEVLDPDPAELPAERVAEARAEETNFGAFIWRQVFCNKYIWIVSVANFFVYTIRYGVFDWAPTMLKEYRGITLEKGALITAGFELAGLAGTLITGQLTDRLFRGRGAPLSMLCMLCAGVTVFCFWKFAANSMTANVLLIAAAGFFVYGPQALVAVIVAKLATKRAAATAVGLTSIFGYGSVILSGWGMGAVVDHYGWGSAFIGLIAAAAVGAVLFAVAMTGAGDAHHHRASPAA